MTTVSDRANFGFTFGSEPFGSEPNGFAWGKFQPKDQSGAFVPFASEPEEDPSRKFSIEFSLYKEYLFSRPLYCKSFFVCKYSKPGFYTHYDYRLVNVSAHIRDRSYVRAHKRRLGTPSTRSFPREHLCAHCAAKEEEMDRLFG